MTSNHNSTYRLRHLRITGGFLDGMDFTFADGLNCIIGARGTGKTSTLELIRYALDLVPTEPATKRHFDSVITNILAGGRVELFVTTANGVDYVISRTGGEEPMLLNADGTPSGLQYSKSIFRLDIFSQNEVENIASNPAFQLPLIDAFSRESLDTLTADISEARRNLGNCAERLAMLWSRISELNDAVSALPGVEEKLKSFVAKTEDSASAVSKANEFRSLRDREKSYAERLKGVYATYGQAAKRLKGGIRNGLNGVSLGDFSESPNYETLRKMYDILSRCNLDADAMIDRLVDGLLTESWSAYSAECQKLLVAHQEQELKYAELIEKTDADRSILAERMKLERERNRLKEQESELQERRGEYDRLQEEQQGIKDHLSELLDKQFEIRQEIASKINEKLMPRIRVSLMQFGDTSIYQRLLGDELKGHTKYFNMVAEKVTAKLSPSELVAYIRDANEMELQNSVGITPGQAKDIIATFRGRESALAALETVEQPDLPQIELNDNEHYKTTDRLSTGQKCNALLPILLMDSDRPLIIDQPEDNLDNGCIHDTIVKSIRVVKDRRQLVFATHNPNIPVLGDADVILVMESDGKKGRSAKQGSIENCKTEIINLLEGGHKAFEERMKRYDYRTGEMEW